MLRRISIVVISLCHTVCTCYAQKITLSQDTSRYSFELKPVEVITDRLASKNNEYKFNPQNVKPIITIMGETDIMRYIGTLPGVSQGIDGGMAYYVRGGNNSNNIVELDKVPVYGSTHLFGLFSTFNSDIIESATFKMGSIPSNSGDFLSAITQVKTITPDSMIYRGNFNISPFMLGASLNGFLPKSKVSFVVSGRLSLLKPEISLIKSITKMEADINPQIGDLFLKLGYKLNSKHAFDLGGYYSNDYLAFLFRNETNIELNWNNRNLRFNWNYDYSPKLKFSTVAYLSQFKSSQRQRYYNTATSGELESDLRIQTALNEQAVKSEACYKIHNWDFVVGANAKFRRFSPAAKKILVGKSETNAFDKSYSTQLFTLYGDATFRCSNFKINIGTRQNYYIAQGIKKYMADIRADFVYKMTELSGVEISYDLMSQTHHIVEGLPMGWSVDLMIPSYDNYVPEVSNQLYTGGYLSNRFFTASAGIYFKKLRNLIGYINSTNIFGVQNTEWKEEITTGEGLSYGLEVRLEKRIEKWNGNLSYTLSKTTRRYENVNNNEWYPFKFDRRHIINFNSQLQTVKNNNKEQFLMSNISYTSGHLTTLPLSVYEGEGLPYWNLIGSNYRNYLMDENSYSRQKLSDINDYRLSDYLRIDLGYTFKKTHKKHTTELTLGIFNVLNKKNPYLMFYNNGTWKQLSLFPIIPSIKWNISFTK